MEQYKNPYIDNCRPINHIFEYDFIVSWIELKHKCPLSRKTLNIEDIRKEYNAEIEIKDINIRIEND